MYPPTGESECVASACDRFFRAWPFAMAYYSAGRSMDKQAHKCADLLCVWVFALRLHADDAQIMAILALVYTDTIVRTTGCSLCMSEISLCFLLAVAMVVDEPVVIDSSWAMRLHLPHNHNNALLCILERIGYNAVVDAKKLVKFKLHVQSLVE